MDRDPDQITGRFVSSWVIPLVMVLLLATGPALAQSPGNQANQDYQQFVPGRILVGFRPNVDRSRAEEVIARLGAAKRDEIPGIGVHIVELPPNANEQAFAHAFAAQPEVEFAELDMILPPAGTANDPYYPYEWHLANISAPAAWDSTTGSSNVTIAILDTGVQSTHPDLASKLVPGWNFYDNNSNTEDVYGHGTGVAGAAAAESNNGIGVTGVSWGSLIMPIRISDLNGNATFSAMANGLTWAADQGARVANISYIASDSSTVASAAQYFQSKGGVVTVSAGNNATFDSSADNPYVLTVSATTSSDTVATWSNTGNNIDISAPGENIYSTLWQSQYASWVGTSLSAPIVAGVAALVISANPGLTGAQVQDILEKSADDLGPAGWDSGFGYGRVNAANAVAMALASGGTTDTTPPTVSISYPGSGATVSGTVSVQASASDNVGVASVSLSVDGSILATDTASPFSFSWNTASLINGTHTLTATAKDAAGNSATSAALTVMVSNSDTTPPTVGITSPGAGATVSGTISVQVSASDNVGVASVSLSIDGVILGTDTSAPYTFSWNTSSAANGSHTVSATATDAAGNTATTSILVQVQNAVADTTPPTISINSPVSGATVSGNVSVTVSASDNVRVVKVELYVDGILKASSTAAPFTTKWNTKQASKGAHKLQCKAYDAAGNVGTSVAITVYK